MAADASGDTKRPTGHSSKTDRIDPVGLVLRRMEGALFIGSHRVTSD